MQIAKKAEDLENELLKLNEGLIEQFEVLRETILAGDIDAAVAWLDAAIKKLKEV